MFNVYHVNFLSLWMTKGIWIIKSVL